MSASEPRAPEPDAPEPGAPGPDAAEAVPRAREQPEPGSSGPEGRPRTYEEAAARIEQIIRRLDSGEASLNETLELVREGKGLIELCASELQAVAGALEELRLEELVERLEGEVTE